MIFTLSAKILGTAGGLAAALACDCPLLVAALLGIAPIWAEVAATLLTGREPSLESRAVWRLADAVVDAASFVLIPSIWAALRYPVLWWGVGPFIVLGLYRIARFLRVGLVDGRYFEGLPVTYTGYLWLPVVSLSEGGWTSPALLALWLVAAAMVSTRIKIPRTHTRHDAPSVD